MIAIAGFVGGKYQQKPKNYNYKFATVGVFYQKI